MIQENIDDFDLKGVLFVHYPMDLSWDEARERLEMDIEETVDEYNQLITAPDIAPYEPKITPYWIFSTLSRLRHEEVAAMSPAVRKANLEYAIKEREERRLEMMKTFHHTTPQQLKDKDGE